MGILVMNARSMLLGLGLMGVLLGLPPTSQLGSAYAGDEATAAPELEKHRVGRYRIERPGMPAEIWLRAFVDYGGTTDISTLAGKIRRGDVKWITREDGAVSFEVHAPESYESDVPHGVLVFISAGDTGNLTGEYDRLLVKHRLIAVGPNDAGNQHSVVARHVLAIQAAQLAQECYTIDPDRIYITGFSGGGRLCSLAMVMASDVFAGGLPMGGANPVIPMRNFSSKGEAYQSKGLGGQLDRARLKRAATRGRYAFMTGADDYNSKNAEAVAAGYRKNGFRHVTYIQEPGRGHRTLTAPWFEKGIMFLDAPLYAQAEEHYKDGQIAEKRELAGNALQAYEKALLHAGDAEWADDVKGKVANYQSQYQTEVDAIEAAINQGDRAKAYHMTQRLRRQWGRLSIDDVKRLTELGRTAGSR